MAKIVIEMVQNEFDTCTICAIQKSNFIHSETEIYHWKGERRKDSCISFILILRNRICECTYQWLYTLFVVRCLPDECAEEEKKNHLYFRLFHLQRLWSLCLSQCKMYMYIMVCLKEYVPFLLFNQHSVNSIFSFSFFVG